MNVESRMFWCHQKPKTQNGILTTSLAHPSQRHATMGPEAQTSLSFRANPEVTQKRAHQLFFQRAIVLGPESFVQRRIYGPVYRVPS